jgi:DNA-binding HxlR family transcriptional regulator
LAGSAVFSYILRIVPTSVLDTSGVARAVREIATRHGGAASVAELRSELGLSERTLHRRLSELVAAGKVSRVSRDRYSSDRASTGALTGEAEEIVRVIEHLDADAHLSGYDVLAGFAHQFVFEYPHLVCCPAPHAYGVAAALIERRFVVIAAGPGALRGPSIPRTVLIRPQPFIARRTLIRGALATPEKAWLDLLRETRRSDAPFDYGELGRLLRAMTDQGINQRALNSYAKRLGYTDWLAATTGQQPPDGRAQVQLAAGYAA